MKPLSITAAALLALSLVPLSLAQKPADIDASKQNETVEIESDRVPQIKTTGSCFIKNGTLLTVTNGVVSPGCILVKDGKIAAIGKKLTAPEGVPVIDATGKFVSPGIVDAHSHMAVTDGDVNEYTDSIVAEVSIRDVLDPQSRSIYQKLASGFTSCLVLHGSSDPIGGQSLVVKLKWKRPVDEMIVPDAPRIIKFALGENVKSNEEFGSRPRRYPGTRMATEAVYRRAFTEAKRYMETWDRYQKARVQSDETSRRIALDPPRRDLRLETLADVLRRKIWVHCHSYRADEMLMMLRLSKEFGFKLAALQHALEAYKIAPEIRDAGVGVSTFADQWGYKVEAYDAIPFNSAMCTRAGIVTSVNTDTFGGVTPLNLDAAKSMKYGGLSADEAVKLVTINPAAQLGISRRTGSLEVGKDADIAIWDGHPLSVYSRCALTMVEGVTLFQRRDAFDMNRTASTSGAPVSCAVDHLALPLPKDSNLYAITGATIHPVSGPDIVGGTVVVENGKIAAVGLNAPVPKGAVVVNAKGLHLYPGLIDAGSNLGIREIEQVPATMDTSETGLFQPDHSALSAVNPASEHLAVARGEGVTTALTRPSMGGFSGGPLVAGQSAVIDLAGWTPEELKERSPAALHVRWPEGLAAMPAFFVQFMSAEDKERREKSQKEEVRKLTEMFERAKRYAESIDAGSAEAFPDAKLKAMAPYATGKAPVVFHAVSVKGMRAALKFAEEHGLKIILADGGHAWRIADQLAAKKIPVICRAQTVAMEGDSSTDYDPYDSLFAGPALLQRAGVKICFESNDAPQSKNLKIGVGQAAAFGLPKAEALRAATLSAAEVLGVADKLGSIEPGKVANLIVTDGDPFETTSSLHYLFIKGKPVSLESRHTRLYQQYRNRK
jgi:imidazolonepropionase-like amidohydrolase